LGILGEIDAGGEGGIILSAFGRQAPRKWLRLRVRACARGGQTLSRVLIPPTREKSRCSRFGSFSGEIGAGGEGGIRTLGALLELGALAKLCFRPLSHLTIEVQEPKYSGNYGKRQTPNGQWIGALPNN
jgi:hypothetical protein